MDRRKFISTLGLAAAGSLAAPYILPSGRLFARTGSRRVGHVVFCLFAGGVRNIESVHQNKGNLMRSMLSGTASTMPGLGTVLPPNPVSQPLQKMGTLFKEFRYAEGPTGHFNGHTVAVTGAYTDTGLNLRQNPQSPTIFEYYRKHTSPNESALNAWWVADQLGPYPALNFSVHPEYGSKFGANFIAPINLFNGDTYEYIGNMKAFSESEQTTNKSLTDFLNANFSKEFYSNVLGNVNTPEEAKRLSNFMQSIWQKALTGGYNFPLGMSAQQANGDVYNIAFAEDILKEFKPELLVVNMTSVDVCHQNFTAYCSNLRKADYAVAHLWKTIQETPGLANDTVLIVAPEHGRNLQPNSIQDVYGEYALDHTSDATSREIFCLVLGPPGLVKQDQVVGTPSQPVGESIDIAKTIAYLLGFDSDIPSGMLNGKVLDAAFV